MENLDPENLDSNVFESYSMQIRERFSDAVDMIISGEVEGPELRNELMQPCRDHYEAWDFYCAQEAWTYAIPHSGKLTLYALSEERIEIAEWQMEVSCFPLSIGGFAHIEIRNVGKQALPFTETGYLSKFLHLSQFAEGKTVRDYLNHLLEPYLNEDN